MHEKCVDQCNEAPLEQRAKDMSASRQEVANSFPQCISDSKCTEERQECLGKRRATCWDICALVRFFWSPEVPRTSKVPRKSPNFCEQQYQNCRLSCVAQRRNMQTA